MRKVFVLIMLIISVSHVNIMCYGQNNLSADFTGRPMPDWIIGSTPQPHNDTYYYKVFEGVHADMEKARQQAIKKAFQQAMAFISTTINSSDIYNAIENGSNLNVISEEFRIPIYFTCEFSRKSKDGKTWHYWILCQIATRGNIVPQFDTHFSECNIHKVWDKMKDDAQHSLQHEARRENVRALTASVFIPGIGQMMKQHYTEGSLILISELALVGGGLGTYFGGKKQLDIMYDRNVEYDAFTNAKSTYNAMRIASYSCYGVAAALYVLNLYRAYTIVPRNQKLITLSPTLISIDNVDLATGVSVKINL